MSGQLIALGSPCEQYVRRTFGQLWAQAPLEYGFRKVRREEGQRQDTAHVALVEAGRFGDCPSILELPLQDAIQPFVSPNDCPDKRLCGPRFATFSGWKLQAHLSAMTFQAGSDD